MSAIDTEPELAIQQKYLQAVLSGSWSSFEHDLNRCQQQIQNRGTPHNSAPEIVASVMNNIKVMSEGFMELHKATVSISSNPLFAFETALEDNSDEFDSTLNVPRLSKPYLQPHRHPRSSPIINASLSSLNTMSASDVESHPLPEFIEHAYKYFVANIHNPYPSREEKQAIADASNNSRVTLTSVSNWFTNARRRCGWAEILKSRCKGNREEMIDISKRIFVKEDPDRPVDPQIIAEFMEMKRNVETMYEKKTRTSAWIEDLDLLVDAISSEKHRDLGNPQVKKKIQAETLCKINRAPRQVQRDQESQIGLSRTASWSSFTSSGSTIDDDESTSELIPIFDSKHKNSLEDNRLRGSSPASSLSSFSFVSDSSDSRVPSLSWSDSADEERPRKRPRSSVDASVSSSPAPSELPFPLDSSFSFSPSSPSPPIIPARGQKRSYDASLDMDATPTAKRIRSDFTQVTQDTNPAPATSTPSSLRRSSFTLVDFDSLVALGTREPQPVEIAPPDTSVPLEVGIFDWSNPLDSFDLTGGLGMNIESTIGNENLLPDFSELFQMVTSNGVATEMVVDSSITLSSPDNTGLDAGIESPLSGFDISTARTSHTPEQSTPSPPIPDLQVDLSSFNLTSLWPQTKISLPGTADFTDGRTLDLSGLISSPVSIQPLDGFEFNYSMQAPAQMLTSVPTPDTFLNSPSVMPTCASTSAPPTPATQDVSSLPDDTSSALDKKKDVSIDLTGQDLAMVEKALRKEYKRRELEEKKAALERERARLEELEKELEDD